MTKESPGKTMHGLLATAHNKSIVGMKYMYSGPCMGIVVGKRNQMNLVAKFSIMEATFSQEEARLFTIY